MDSEWVAYLAYRRKKTFGRVIWAKAGFLQITHYRVCTDYCRNGSKTLTQACQIRRYLIALAMDLHMFQGTVHINWPEKM